MTLKTLCYLITTLVMFMFIRIDVQAETIQVGDSLTTNTKWTADTVQLIGDVIVAPGVTLTVMQGTYVEVLDYHYIKVYGNFSAIGKEDHQITFTVHDTSGFYDNSDNSGGWGGINCITGSATDSLHMEYCNISFGKKVIDSGTWDYDMQGGGIFINGDREAVISNSNIHHNKACRGSAIRAMYVTDNCVISSCKFQENIIPAEHYGGTVEFSNCPGGKIRNCLIYENEAPTGSAIGIYDGSVQFINNTIVNNSSYGTGINGYAIYLSEMAETTSLDFYNNIIYNNTNSEDIKHQISVSMNNGGSAFFTNNIIDDGIENVMGGDFVDNIYSEDPLLANAENGDFRISRDSPAKDAGYYPVSLPYYDINNNPRIQAHILDIGAVEYNFTDFYPSTRVVCESTGVDLYAGENEGKYVWYKEDVLIPGANDGSYWVDGAEVIDSVIYHCYNDSTEFLGKHTIFVAEKIETLLIDIGEDMTKRISEHIYIYPDPDFIGTIEWSADTGSGVCHIEPGELGIGEHKIWVDALDYCGNASSDTMILTIVEKDYGYVSLPVSEIQLCSAVKDSLVSSKTGSAYRWEKDEVILDETGATLVFPSVSQDDTGMYRCIVDTAALGGYYVNFNVDVFESPALTLEPSYSAILDYDTEESIDIGSESDTVAWNNGYTGNSFIILDHYTDMGEYNLSVEITDTNGCKASDATVVYVWYPDKVKEFLRTGNENDLFSVYPNPTDGRVTIYTEEPELNIQILDISGKVVDEIVVEEGTNNIDLRRFQKGTYLIRAEVHKHILVSKLIIE